MLMAIPHFFSEIIETLQSMDFFSTIWDFLPSSITNWIDIAIFVCIAVGIIWLLIDLL